MSVSKSFACLLLLVVCGLVLPMPKAAGEMLDILAIQTGATWQNSTINEIPDITITEVDASDLMTIDFSDFDALYVSDVWDAPSTPDWAGVLNDRSKDILAYINGGGFVLMGGQIYGGVGTNGDEYNFLGGLVDAPAGLEICGDDVVITEPDHPLFVGLTNSDLSDWDLSDWLCSYHGILEGTLPVLATNSGGDPVIRGGLVGAGGAFVWTLDPDFHFLLNGILPALELVENAVGLVVCEGDANGDGLVDPLDSGFVLARFRCDVGAGDPMCDTADMNGDGLVDPLDVGYILARFGPCP